MSRLRFSRLVKRFGISAPRVAIRAQLSWYWRWIGIFVAAAVALVLAQWVYDAGRRYAGYDQGEIEQDLVRVKASAESVNAELARLRAVVDAAENKLAIEHAAQKKLAEQVRGLEKQNAGLREELALFESMLASGARDAPGLAIQRFKVERDAAPGEYRFRLMLFAASKRAERGFEGRLELLVRVIECGRSAIMIVPDKVNSAAYQLSFRQFRRVEGSFRVSPTATLESVQAKIYEAGSDQARATQTFSPG